MSTYFQQETGSLFLPTELCRGPWDANACHAGPPLGLMIREIERLGIGQRLARITVEISRPIPMSGFNVTAAVRRQGRTVSTTEATITDDSDKIMAQATALHIRAVQPFELSTASIETPEFESAVPGPFPITETRHGLTAFPDSLEVRYDPADSQGTGGPTTIWMKTVPLLPDETPSGFQRVGPLADSGNGISYNDYLDRVLFVNPDLTVTFHREPRGEWLCSRVKSYWERDGVGLSHADLFDTSGHFGVALQTLVLDPA